MPVILLIVFIAVPIAEIAIFIEAGDQFGLWPTLGLVILTAILGTSLLRYQGLRTLHRVQKSLEQGEMPVGEVFTGLCLLIAGALLLTPGFLTDAVGFALFVPALRRALSGLVLRALSARGAVWVDGQPPPNGPPPHPRRGAGDTIIDGDFTEVPDEPAPPHKRVGPKKD